MPALIPLREPLLERLQRYVKVHTTSDAASTTVPTTPQQWDLLKLLRDEVTALGMTEVSLDDKGYLFATLPATTDKKVPVLGFMAHVDTAPGCSGENVKPQVIENYSGGDIPLKGSGAVLSPKEFPALDGLHGHTLVTTDGTTLLGADDKSGIAIILSAVEYLLAHPEIPHGKIRVAFTPDEEIGRGPKHFDVKAFGADVAYTVDGGPLGELQYENFNADEGVVTFYGRSVHTGTAKGVMVNGLARACEFHNRLPAHLTPEESEGREGFIHLHKFEGTLEECRLRYLLRSFTREELADLGKMLSDTMAAMQRDYGEHCGKVEIHEQYRNMREKVEPHRYVVDIAEKVMRDFGITPLTAPIRGGTDGAQISYMGLPTPNLFTGGENFHGAFEFISLDVMEQAANVVLGIISEFAQRD
nr:peptidase T [uncultured Cardiobacterium sp.]